MTRIDAVIRLKSRLIARRDALRKALADDVGRLRAASEVVGYGDQVDAATDSANDEICSRLAEIESRELAQLELALQRLIEGRYGRCVSCGDRIPATRLNALPYTTRCIDCQRMDESMGRPEVMSHREEMWAGVVDEPATTDEGDPTAWGGRGSDVDQLAGARGVHAMKMT